MCIEGRADDKSVLAICTIVIPEEGEEKTCVYFLH
jgi:hypothetical protein